MVPNPQNAKKARLCLTLQRPDLADRLVKGAEYHPGEWTGWTRASRWPRRCAETNASRERPMSARTSLPELVSA
jgi:hypothetical protein